MKRLVLLMCACLMLALPVYIAAQQPTLPPSPFGRPAITAANADALVLLARLGSGRFSRIDVSPAGQQVAMLATNGVYLYTLEGLNTLTLLYSIRHTEFTTGFAWNTDGSLFAAISSSGYVTVHDARNGGTLIAQNTFAGTDRLIFHPTAPVLVLAGAGRTTVWNYQTGASLDLASIDFPVTALAFSPDGSQLLIGGDTTVVRLDNLAETLRNTSMPGGIFDIAYSPTMRDTVVLAMAGMADIIRREGDRSVEIPFTLADESAIALAFLPDGSAVIEGWTNGVAFVRDSVSGAVITQFQHDEAVRSLDVAADGTIWSFDQSSTLYQWNATTGQQIARFPVGPVSFASIALSPDGRTLAAGTTHDQSIYLYDLGDFSNADTLVEGRAIRGLAYSADGTRLASIGLEDALLTLWDMTTRTVLRQIPTAHTRTVVSVGFNAAGTQVATGGADGLLNVFDAASGAVIITENFGVAIGSLAYTPDDRRLIVGLTNGQVLLIQPGDWTVSSTQQAAFTEPLRSVAVDSSGQRVLNGGGINGNWFNLALPADSAPVFNPAWVGLAGRMAALSPDSTLFVLASPREEASGGDDVRLYTVAGSETTLAGRVQSPMAQPSAVAFTADGSLLILSAADGYIDVYGAPGVNTAP